MAVATSMSERRETRRAATESVFRQTVDASLRDRRLVQDAAIVEFLDVADAVARRFMGPRQDGDDIRQVAYLGLVKAAARFDPDKGDDFVSFAVPTISGEIKRHLRDNGWVIRPPRRIQELRGRAMSAGPRLAQILGRSPSHRELAEYLGESVAALAEAHLSQDGLSPASLDRTISDDDELTLADALGADDARLARVELAADLRLAVRSLTARERTIVQLRFFEERTQQQIATELGITQMQVSRLLVRILDRLRIALGGRPAAAATASGDIDLISA